HTAVLAGADLLFVRYHPVEIQGDLRDQSGCGSRDVFAEDSDPGYSTAYFHAFQTGSGFLCHAGAGAFDLPLGEGRFLRAYLNMPVVSFQSVSKFFHRHAGQMLLRDRLSHLLRAAARERFYALRDVTFSLEHGESLA